MTGFALNTVERFAAEYSWPSAIQEAWDEGIRTLDWDDAALQRVLKSRQAGGYLAVTFVSRDYLSVAAAWLACAKQARLRDVVVAAVDSETVAAMQALRIPCFRVHLPEFISESDHVNAGGFRGAGLAIIAARLLVCEFVVAQGCDVMQIDVDALVLRDPSPHIQRNSDVAFQRVVYFPKAAVSEWGFAACGGFVAYRASPNVQRFLGMSAAAIRFASSDQIALNMAIMQSGCHWTANQGAMVQPDDLKARFIADSSVSFQGRTLNGLILEALPATTFWRHQFVPFDAHTCVLCHPNSPKNARDKLLTLSTLLPQVVSLLREGAGL